MVRYEIKKLLGNRLNQIAMALGFVLILVVFFSQNFGSDSIYSVEREDYIFGIEAVEYAKKLAASQGDYLTEETATDYIREVQEYSGDLGTDEAYSDVIRRNGSMFYYITYCYSDLNEQMCDFNRLKELDLSDGAHFYDRRIEKISDFLNMDFSYGNYTEQEKAFWLAKAAEVETPFKWGAKVGVNRMLDLCFVNFYLLFVVIVCISPMFSKENDTGAAQLLLSTKKEKTGLIGAKVIASLSFAVVYLLFCSGVQIVATGLVCGFEGLALPVQIMNNAIPYAMTMGQLLLLVVFLLDIVLPISIICVMLLLSAATKHSIGTMSATLVLLIGPAFIGYSRSNGFFNHLLDLCYIKAAQLTTVLVKFSDFRFGPLIIDQITMIVIVWLLIAVLCLLPLRRVFVARLTK